MAKVFLTGASGYIGGQVLRELSRSQTKFSIRALVRDPKKALAIKDVFPDVRAVIGDLDNTELLIRETADAAIVLHLAATGHLNSLIASAAYWIQVSGASALAAGELASPSFVPGSASETVFNDYHDVADVQSIIRKHPARAVDNYILDNVSTDTNIRTALVFPPIIYGLGEGPLNQRSIQIPSLASATIKLGHGIRVGSGENRWGNVHIRDVGRIFSTLAEAAANGRNDEGLWGHNALYLAGVGEVNFAEISARVAAAAKHQGLIASDKVEELRQDQYDTVLPHGKVLFGTNARGQATRARKLLGWAPREISLENDVERTVSEENRRGNY
ncbi:putative nucleoside-diphosphate-sugar epimerase [Metarhizium anisopliae]